MDSTPEELFGMLSGEEDEDLEIVVSERGTEWGSDDGGTPLPLDVPGPERVARFFEGLNRTTGMGGQLELIADLDRPSVEDFQQRFAQLPGPVRGNLIGRLNVAAANQFDLQFGRLFVALLGDEDAVVRQRAVQGLADEQSPEVLAVLVGMAESDYSVDVRVAAVAALTAYAEDAAAGDDVGMDADELRDVLETIAVDEAEPAALRRQAMESLAVFGSRGAEAFTSVVAELIVDAYDDGESVDQAAALSAMGRTLDPRWLPYIERDLDHADEEVRLAAVVAAGHLGDTTLVEAVTARTKDDDDDVRLAAIRSLGQIASPGAVRVLRNLAQDPERDDHDAIDEALEEATLGDDIS
jgi:HEAT repeat protein